VFLLLLLLSSLEVFSRFRIDESRGVEVESDLQVIRSFNLLLSGCASLFGCPHVLELIFALLRGAELHEEVLFAFEELTLGFCHL